MNNSSNGLAIIVLPAIFIVACMAIYDTYFKDHRPEQTTRIVKGEASRIIWNKYTSTDQIKLTKKDAWGNELKYAIAADQYSIDVTVTSPGPDGNFDTRADNISVTKMSLNKSRIIGGFVGSKLKEAGKGVWDGLKVKSEFEGVE